MSDKNHEPYKPHPIQIIGLKVLELSIIVNSEFDSGNLMPNFNDVEGSFTWNNGYSEYDAENQQILVKAVIDIGGDEEDDSPFKLKLALVGSFKVDESRFKVEHLSHWASHNAPLILYPYLRELAYSLTTRAGFPGVMLPLLQIPTFKISKESNNDSSSSN